MSSRRNKKTIRGVVKEEYLMIVLGQSSLILSDAFLMSTGVRHHSFVETEHEIFSTVILFLPLIQERQLSVERICTSTA